MRTKKQIKIFIIEDNAIFALALKADLETSFEGYFINIQIFETGEDCMEKFKDEKPKIVILDYHLNNKNPNAADGVKVLDWLRKESKETYVIMLTHDDNIEIALQSFKHGASDYIVKTDTQFRKIIFSISNIFRMIASKSEARRYRFMVIGISLGVAVIIGFVLAIHIFAPSIL